jgi:putative restriction endonuclease
MTTELYCGKLTRLRVNVQNGHVSPHKICMLLAMFDLALAGGLRTNRIEYGPALLERYRRFFDAVRTPSDHINPYFPFFHLRGPLRDGRPSFWHLCPRPGREAVAAAMTTAQSSRDITDNFSHACLDEELFQLLQSPGAVHTLSATLAGYWLDRGLPDLRGVVERTARISVYEYRLRTRLQPPAGVAEAPPPAYVRDPAFRRVVTEAYDYRCAATGLRVLLPSGEAMVEAAHIHPFSVAADDDPRNGLALTPDMHWAMDRNLIAPGPDYRWHVSPLLDSRVPDNARFCALDGKSLILPSEGRMYPKQDALEWRIDRLRDPDWCPAQCADSSGAPPGG